MPSIDQIIAQIRTAVYGKDVRENIADGIEQCYEDSTANAQMALIEAKGAETIASIPSDYTELCNDVNNIKKGVSNDNKNILEAIADESIRNVLLGVEWEHGGIRTSTGQNAANEYNSRTVDYIDLCGMIGNIHILSKNTDPVHVCILSYDETKTFIKYSTIDPETDVAATTTIPYNAKYIRVMVANQGWGILDNLDLAYNISIYFRVSYRKINSPELSFTKGTISEGIERDSETRIVSDYIAVGAGTKITCALGRCINIHLYDERLKHSENPLLVDWEWQHTIQEDCYIKIVLRYSSTSNPNLTEEYIQEILDNFRMWYQPPTNPKISQNYINGVSVYNDFDLKNYTNIISGYVWEQGYIGYDGNAIRNLYVIRTRHFIKIKKTNSLLVSVSKPYESVIGFINFYDSNKDFISRSGINGCETNPKNVSVPQDAEYIKVTAGPTWTDIHLFDTTFADGLVIEYAEDATSSGIIGLNNPIETVSKLQQLKFHPQPETIKPLSLLWYSDLHNNVANYRRIYEFRDAYSEYIDFTINTGDIINKSTEDATVFNDPYTLNVIGNHETWDGVDSASHWRTVSEHDLYNLYIAPYINNWGAVCTVDKCYYYKDFPNSNIRLICLDCMHDSSAQVSWLENTLNGALISGYDVIIASHVKPAQNPDLIPLNTPWHNGVVYNGNQSEIASFPRWTPIAYRNAVDTFVNNGGNVACWMSGHIHSDVCGTWHNILSVSITTAGDISPTRAMDSRKYNTKAQDAFNVIAIDPVYKLVKIIRIGQDYSISLQHIDTLCWDYQNHILIS